MGANASTMNSGSAANGNAATGFKGLPLFRLNVLEQPERKLAHAEEVAIAPMDMVQVGGGALSQGNPMTSGAKMDPQESAKLSLKKDLARSMGKPIARVELLDGQTLYLGKPAAGDEALMDKKDYGTCRHKPASDLRWKTDEKMVHEIGCWNRHYTAATTKKDLKFERFNSAGAAVPKNYWDKYMTGEYLDTYKQGTWLEDVETMRPGEQMVFYDSVTAKPVFVAPQGRTWHEFMEETKKNGKPSFRREEAVQENVRVLKSGAVVSPDGTHLGAYKPDRHGDRYSINLISVSGTPSNGAAGLTVKDLEEL